MWVMCGWGGCKAALRLSVGRVWDCLSGPEGMRAHMSCLHAALALPYSVMRHRRDLHISQLAGVGTCTQATAGACCGACVYDAASEPHSSSHGSCYRLVDSFRSLLAAAGSNPAGGVGCCRALAFCALDDELLLFTGTLWQHCVSQSALHSWGVLVTYTHDMGSYSIWCTALRRTCCVCVQYHWLTQLGVDGRCMPGAQLCLCRRLLDHRAVLSRCIDALHRDVALPAEALSAADGVFLYMTCRC